jgi:hypothetical protein
MLIAASAAASSAISTNPKPLLLPVMRSMMIVADTTVPAFANASLRALSVVV